MLRFAIYVSSHGFGHSTRMSALAEELIQFGVFCHIISDKPAYLYANLNPHYYTLHPRKIDGGVKHSKNLNVNITETVNSLLDLLYSRNEIMEREIEFLRQEKIDCIIADVPFLVSDFAAYCNIPVFAVTNFEWHFIYQSIFAQLAQIKEANTAENKIDLEPVLNLIWSCYQRFDECFRLPFSTEESMSAFPHLQSCGLLSRKKEHYNNIRSRYNLKENTPILLVMFGGEGAMELNYAELCSAYEGIVISTQTGVQAENHIQVSKDEDFLDLIYSANIILCKPGYSSLAEATQLGKFIIYCPRKNYPEEKALIAGMQKYPNCLQIGTLQHSRAEWKSIFNSIQPCTIKTKAYRNCNREVAGMVLNKYSQRKGNQLISIFDLGSNNLNYLLYDREKQQVIHKTQVTTALGKNFRRNRISALRLNKVKKAINSLFQLDSYLKSEKVLLATGVMRKAVNAASLIDWITNKYGISCRIISPEEEIRYAYYAAKNYRNGEEASLAIDIGGFSTEVIDLNKEKKQQGISLPFGLITLLNDFDAKIETAENYIKDILAAIPDYHCYKLIGIGLTYTYLAAVVYKCSYADIEKQEGKSISKRQLQHLLQSIARGEEAEYLPFLLEASYLPVLKLSIIFNISLLDRFEVSEIIVCNSGILVGYANWLSAKKKRKAQK